MSCEVINSIGIRNCVVVLNTCALVCTPERSLRSISLQIHNKDFDKQI